MLNPIVFWGGSGHAKVLREFIGQVGYRLVAVFDNSNQVPPPFSDVPIYYGRDGFLTWQNQVGETQTKTACLVAIGGHRGRTRVEIQEFLELRNLRPIIAVHPTAFVAGDVRLGAGCQVLANAAVGVETRIGIASIVNTAASVDHESVLGRGVHIAPGATVAGCVQIGDYSFVGAGAVVLPRIKIGRNAIVGAGAVVTREIPDNTIAFGNPAKVVRENLPEESLDAKL